MKTDRFILIVGIISILCSIFVLAVTVPECLDHNLVSFSKPIQEEQEETAPSEEIQDTPPTADAVVYIFPAVVPNSEPQSLPFTSETHAPNPEPEMEQEQPKTGDDIPIDDSELVILAKVLYQESQSIYWNGEMFGVSCRARQAAVAWTAFNRLDTGDYGDSLAAVLTAEGQYAYYDWTPVTDDMLALATDVAMRWWAEKQGSKDVGRTLPQDYLWFCGDGNENYFMAAYSGGETWDWSLPDPYGEEDKP